MPWGAAPAAEKTTADAATNSKDALLDPLALLQAYEKTLVPYQRVKAKWVERFARLNSVNEPEWLDREPDEWTVVRDGDRAKSTVTITWKKTGEKGQLPPRSGGTCLGKRKAAGQRSSATSRSGFA